MASILAAMALIGLAAPAGAAAAKTYHEPAGVSAAIFGHGTHGFDLYLLAFDRGVVIAATKAVGGEGQESVAYVDLDGVRPKALERGRLDVKVGRLGHFRGHFVATSTKTQKPGTRCTGDPTVNEEGYFVGSFVFHGERGYTSVQTPRMSGSITRQGPTDCPIPNESGNHRHGGQKAEELAKKAAERDEVNLLAGDKNAKLVLQANREQAPPEPDGPATTTFQASLRDHKVGAFQIDRSAAVFDRGRDAPASFLVPNLAEPLAELTLEPPAPFSGSATFQLEDPRQASWTGDLAVELPGAGKVHLTGRKIYAGACKGRTNCTKTLPGLLGELIEATSDVSIVISENTGKRGS